MRDAESWSRISEAAKRITAQLQQAWDDEWAALASQGNEQHVEDVADLEARRAEIRRARNDGRNASRRAAMARQREQKRAGRPPSPPPSPRTAARRVDLRLRQAWFRERRRQAMQDVRRLYGERGPASASSSSSDDDDSDGRERADNAAEHSERRNRANQRYDEATDRGLSAAEEAAAVEAEVASR